MSRPTLAGLTFGVLVLTAGCTAPRPATSQTGSPVPASDAAFVQEMVAYHDHSLAVLALADTRAVDPQVKAVAVRTAALQRLQRTTMVTLLIGWAQPTTLPARLDEHQTLLTGLSGDAFDQGLLTAMIAHNDTAVGEARAALSGPLSPTTRAIATSVDTGLTADNTALQQLLAGLADKEHR